MEAAEESTSPPIWFTANLKAPSQMLADTMRATMRAGQNVKSVRCLSRAVISCAHLLYVALSILRVWYAYDSPTSVFNDSSLEALHDFVREK